MDSKLFKVTINMKEITEEGTLNENDITILKLIAKSINFIQCKIKYNKFTQISTVFHDFYFNNIYSFY